MTENNQALTIFEPKNVQTIAELVPQSYDANKLSCTRCIEAGNLLLQRVQKEGMTDVLDLDIAGYLEKTKVTLRKMNGRRSPVTQMFDQIRKIFTSMENDIDPSKSDSIPAQLQAYRNAYAKKKRDEEERRRREEAARLAKENAISRYRADVDEDYRRQFNALVNTCANELIKLDRSVTIENYQAALDTLKAYPCELPVNWCPTVISGAPRPAELTTEECRAIQANVMSGLFNQFKEQFPFEVQSIRDEILDRLPSKYQELQRVAKASAEEAARIKAEIEAKERAEVARREEERRERERQEAEAAKLAAKKQEMDNLFGMPATPTAYQPKTSVKKKVVINSPDDIMKILGFWWSQEGCTKTIEELGKEFRKQINYANAAANSKDNPTLINGLRYEDEVKAK
ncbi:MAG: hypothetical protein J6K19_03765 [Prevotella sp.]|nr:hypothetical protein [Prevotella sp.]